MLTTKTPKATVGGLSPSKGYILQIFELTGSGRVMLAQREFVSKSAALCQLSASGWGGGPFAAGWLELSLAAPLGGGPRTWICILPPSSRPGASLITPDAPAHLLGAPRPPEALFLPQWGPESPPCLPAVEDLKSHPVSGSSRQTLGESVEPMPTLEGSPDPELQVTSASSQGPPALGGSTEGGGK